MVYRINFLTAGHRQVTGYFETDETTEQVRKVIKKYFTVKHGISVRIATHKSVNELVNDIPPFNTENLLEAWKSSPVMPKFKEVVQ